MKRIIAILFLLVAVVAASLSAAEEAWAMCQPDSNVYIRSNPSFNADVVAILEVGDQVETDGKKDGVWVHAFFTCEAGEGWMHRGYMTYSEPDVYRDGISAETAYKQVNARRCAKGKINRKLKKGTQLTVFVTSDEWSITNLGYIQTRYLAFKEGE